MEDYSFLIFIAVVGIIAFNIFILVKFLQIVNDLRDLKEMKKRDGWKDSKYQEDVSTILEEIKLLLKQNKKE